MRNLSDKETAKVAKRIETSNRTGVCIVFLPETELDLVFWYRFESEGRKEGSRRVKKGSSEQWRVKLELHTYSSVNSCRMCTEELKGKRKVGKLIQTNLNDDFQVVVGEEDEGR